MITTPLGYLSSLVGGKEEDSASISSYTQQVSESDAESSSDGSDEFSESDFDSSDDLSDVNQTTISDNVVDSHSLPSTATKFNIRDFNRNFKNSRIDPKKETLLKVYSCALSREILHQGKMYVTYNYICFNSRIFGVSHKVCLPFKEVTLIEPKRIINIFPNSIEIGTLDGSRYMFASFTNRNSTLKVLRQLRKESSVVESGGKGSESDDASRPQPRSRAVSGASQTLSSSPNSNKDQSAMTPSRQHSKRVAPVSLSPQSSKEASGTLSSPSHTSPSSSSTNNTASNNNQSSSGWPVPNLGPETHPKTQLPQPRENEKVLLEETISAPPGVVFNIVFGNNTAWYKNFLLNVDKNRDLDELPPFPQLASGSERKFEYVKPLSGPVGPKQTRCKCTEKIERYDFDNYIEITTATLTPDVPAGNSFVTQTRMVFAWGANNTTTLRLGTWLEWTGKTWLKVAIEKGAVDGQTQYCKSLVQELTKACHKEGTSHVRPSTDKHSDAGSVKVTREKRRSEDRKSIDATVATRKAADAISAWQRLCLGLIVLSFVLFVLMVHFWRKSRHPQLPQTQYDLFRIEKELELWQWIDERQSRQIPTSTLNDVAAYDAILQAEKRLESLKQTLMKR